VAIINDCSLVAGTLADSLKLGSKERETGNIVIEQCVRKVAVHLQKVLEVTFTNHGE
jgi:hypothetical protein